jgi:DNA-binding PadR family transcriptional regulator
MDEEQDFLIRRGPGHGPGFGPPFGRGPHVRRLFLRGGPGMGMPPQRRMRRGDVRFAVIDVLADAAMHGYEIIRTLEERSGGRWRPSPGSVYPTLQLLADEGLVTAEDIDGRRVYSLTDAGRAAREARRDDERAWEMSADDDDPRAKLGEAAFGVHEAAMQVIRLGTDDQITRAHAALNTARRSLYALLAEDTP